MENKNKDYCSDEYLAMICAYIKTIEVRMEDINNTLKEIARKMNQI